MNIILIGYRGTGKTTVGKALAGRLGLPFFDADVYLEEKAGRTIADMVAKEGWPFFRALEKDVLRELSRLDGCVIAAGGGAVMDQENVVNLGRRGCFVLLKADTEALVRRILGDPSSEGQRPKLLGGDLYEETEAMVRQRMPVYEAVSAFAVDTGALSVPEVVDAVADFVQTRVEA